MISIQQSISCTHVKRKYPHFAHTRFVIGLSQKKRKHRNSWTRQLLGQRWFTYIRDSIFIQYDKVSAHCSWAKCSKSLRLHEVSIDIARCKLRASTTFDDRFVKRPWGEPEVIIDVGGFSGGTKWPALFPSSNKSSAFYKLYVHVEKVKMEITLSLSNLCLPYNVYSSTSLLSWEQFLI